MSDILLNNVSSEVRVCPFTIVTAFMSQINARGDRPVQKYIDLGKSLLALHIPQIIFIERHIYETYLRVVVESGLESGYRLRFFAYGGRAYEYIVLGHLTFVFFERADMYLEEYREMATEFSLNTPHPTKDTLDYMFVQCYKTEWVSMAIALSNDTNTNNLFAWMDFGLRHMYPSSMAFDIAVYGFRYRMLLGGNGLKDGSSDTNCIYAPSCWNAGRTYAQDVYREIFWVFSGSAFCGKPNALLEFARRTKSKCIEILTVRRRLMWEVNVWYLVYRDCPALFSLYYGNHNAGILGGGNQG
jgi:hypothetical protein